MDLSPMFWICVAMWLCAPGVALLIRRQSTAKHGRRPCKTATVVIHWVYYITVLSSIAAAFGYHAATGNEWPLLGPAWILVMVAPLVAVYVLMDDRLAFP